MAVNGVLLAGALGAALLGVAVSDRLLVATYSRDLATLCHAESESGFTMSRNTARVTAWIQDHVRTPDGGRLLASLRDRPLTERAQWLGQRAHESGLASCPMVEAYEELSGQWQSRRELQSLCSAVTFPELGTLDEDARLQVVDEWIEMHASTAVVRLLSSRLRRAGTAADRAEVLRDAASDVGVLTCDVAKILSVPVKKTCDP
jgi:hypothetical protein